VSAEDPAHPGYFLRQAGEDSNRLCRFPVLLSLDLETRISYSEGSKTQTFTKTDTLKVQGPEPAVIQHSLEQLGDTFRGASAKCSARFSIGEGTGTLELAASADLTSTLKQGLRLLCNPKQVKVFVPGPPKTQQKVLQEQTKWRDAKVTKDTEMQGDKIITSCSSEFGMQFLDFFLPVKGAAPYPLSCAKPVPADGNTSSATVGGETAEETLTFDNTWYSRAPWTAMFVNYADVRLNTRASPDFSGRASFTGKIHFTLEDDWTPLNTAGTGTTSR
jgi:hypothetical protein